MDSVQNGAPVAAKRSRLTHHVRRQRIIEAALATLARDGAAASLRGVCREAGISPSLVTHFFGSWQGLLAATYDALAYLFLAPLMQAMVEAHPSARARMEALVARYLSPDWVGEHTIGANIALWHFSRTVVDLQPAFSRFYEDRKRLLARGLADVATEAHRHIDIETATACLMLLLDGIWLEMSLNPGQIGPDRALELCWFLIDGPPR